MNLATAQQQLGRWGDALRGYERAHRLCRALAQGTEASKTTVAILRFNLANLHLACGDDARASYWLDDADEAEGALRAALLIARGERHELRGERAAAEAAFREAADSAQADAPREYIEARQKLGDACVREAEALGAIDLRARAALIGAKAQPSPLDAVREAQRLAEASADRALQAEIAGRAASMLRELGADAAADEWAERARLLWDEILLSLDREAAEAFKAHPLRVGLRRRQRPSESGEGDAQALRRILQINRKLNSNLPTSALLEHALDAAIELSRAERGFVLLAEAPMRVATARNMDRDRLRQPALRFSRSIAEEVVESRAPVLTTNAREDPRYVQQRSVLAMGLQSVACVPIESPDGVLGALYVDHRFLPGHFNAATLERLMLLADQVALALQGAQLRAQLEEKAARLEQEVAQRTSRLKAQEAALSASETALARITGGREARTDHAPLIGRSAAMHRVFDMLDRLKGRAVSVLIEGESGVGKELVARALHHDDALPFKAVNCAALPEALLESQLFGHRRGAFTGATDHREGLFVAAGEGSVLLDEVGELALPMQAKLLRALQEREVLPVGADAHRPFAARVLAATNRDLREEVADGRFREDLYYRLAVVTLPVPALRERTDDVPLLCEALLARAAEEQRVPAKPLSEGALRTILTHPWPGNVRELANVLRRALIFAPGPSIEADDLELGMPPSAAPQSRDAFEQDEAARIGAVLQDVGWNVSEASRRLAMPRNTLYRRMKKYGLR
ncbi:MAG: sigma-54-dependent Fis family transcriptional regulator [Myxococcota bacterium]